MAKNDNNPFIAAMVKGCIIHYYTEMMVTAVEASRRADIIWTKYKAGELTAGSEAHVMVSAHEYDAISMLYGLQRAGYMVTPSGTTVSALYICPEHEYLGVSQRTTCEACEAKWQEWKLVSMARRLLEQEQP